MKTNRLHINTQLTEFIRTIKIDLPSLYGLNLYGSWSTGEYHAVKRNKRIYSFSDIDYMCDDLPDEPTRRIIENKIRDCAETNSLIFKGISIRSAKEMRNMWLLESDVCHNNDEHLEHDFLQFWTLIGAAELCAALFTNYKSAQRRDYFLNKYFWGIWRDLGIVSGHYLSTYKEVADFASRFMSPQICQDSFEMKLGSKPPKRRIQILSAHKLIIRLFIMNLRLPSNEESIISTVINELSNINCSKARDWADKILKYASALENGLFYRKAAVKRILCKIEV